MAFLRAFGSYVPSRIVGNPELEALLGCDSDWIVSVSGISERRYADDTESVVDLAVNAATDCLSRARVQPSDVGLVIVASGSAGRRFPGPAAETASRLGMAGTPSIDLPMASAGSLFGMAIGAQLAALHGRVLVIAAEKMSAVISRPPLDRNTAILFGDGAGACLIDPKDGVAEIIDSSLHSDGSFAHNLLLEFDQPIHMDGRVVILQASRKVPAVIRELLDRHQRPASSIATFLMHQANQNLITRIAQALEVAPEKFYSNIARYGNTSSASMLIAASEWNAFRKDEPVVFAAFGAGFHWGALLALGT
ncbi:MAG TPA: ketoacyl-ACP synthase III [Bryobacteraceae bacterium]|nr:ketoacyl-ACP synthase III [Bryobacteraceae bacterium]